MNTLNKEVMTEIVSVLNDVQNNPAVNSAVLISNKPTSFIAGADITMLEKCKTEHDGYKISKDGQEILNRIATSSKPVIAAIHGSCLGGGLEVRIKLHFYLSKKILTKYYFFIF